MGYTAYNLSEKARAMLLSRFPPLYERVVCHHVTVHPNVDELHPLPPAASLKVVGYTSDGIGVEALVVEVDGELVRPVGSIYHITHSLAEGRAKVESNAVIEQCGWRRLEEAIEIETAPCWND